MPFSSPPPPPRFGMPLRRQWALRSDAAYLNHGSYGATPTAVLAAQDGWRRRMERQPVQFMQRELPTALRAAAAALAGFVGAQAEDLVFVDNATTAVNAVLRSQELSPGDEVVTTSHVYGAVRQTLRYVCARTGARLVEVPLPFPVRDEETILAAVEAALGPHVKLAVLDHVASTAGAILPIQALVAICRAKGVRVLVDGAHAPGMLLLDVPSLGADWYAGNAHKWLCACKGCGFLWASRKVQADLHPAVISHGYGQGWLAEFDWTGTRDPSAFLAVTAALDFHHWLGPDKLRAYNHDLVLTAGRNLVAAWGGELGTPPEMTGSMLCVRLPLSLQGEPTMEAAARLHDRLWEEQRIEVPVIPVAGALWVRLSAQVYNILEDYERLLETVNTLCLRRH